MFKIEKKTIVFIFCVFVLLVLSSADIFAAGVEAMPWDTAMDKVYKSLTGRTVMIVGGIMVVGAGITMAFSGSNAIGKIMWLIVGIGIALNAPNLLNIVSGNANAAMGFLIPGL